MVRTFVDAFARVRRDRHAERVVRRPARPALLVADSGALPARGCASPGARSPAGTNAERAAAHLWRRPRPSGSRSAWAASPFRPCRPRGDVHQLRHGDLRVLRIATGRRRRLHGGGRGRPFGLGGLHRLGALAQVLTCRRAAARSIGTGMTLCVGGWAVVGVAAGTGAKATMVVGAGLVGAGSGLTLMGSAALIGAISPLQMRAELYSAYLVVAFTVWVAPRCSRVWGSSAGESTSSRARSPALCWRYEPAVLGEPVGDAPSGRAETEPQLEEPTSQAAGQRHPGQRPEVGQPVHDHHHPLPLFRPPRWPATRRPRHTGVQGQ